MNEYYEGIFKSMLRTGSVPARVREAFDKFMLIHQRHGGGEVSPDIMALLCLLVGAEIAPDAVPEENEFDDVEGERPAKRGRKAAGTVAVVE